MNFDRQLAEELLDSTKDRDAALFFAGRGDEIKAFKGALREADKYNSASFRIYQGPPGCGKTSLARHLADTHDVLFLGCRSADLADDVTLLRKIREGALARESVTKQVGGAALDAAAKHLKIDTLAKAVRDVMRQASRAQPVVLHLDEAHGCLDSGEPPGVGRTLRDLHTIGIGAPCVVLLTGLEHTVERVQGVPGLSRLAEKASRRVKRLSDAECADSTRQMLNALGVGRDNDLAARKIAAMAFGWPQHLHCAQQELTTELIRHDGSLDRVDWRSVGERTAARRSRYYEARLADPIFQIDPETTWKVLRDVHRDESCWSRRHLVEAITARFKRDRVEWLYEDEGVKANAMAKALREKGVLTEHGKTGWEMAVPSMAEWAERMVARFRRAERGGDSGR